MVSCIKDRQPLASQMNWAILQQSQYAGEPKTIYRINKNFLLVLVTKMRPARSLGFD